MKERFEGDGRPNLVDALKRQEFVNGNVDLANAMSEQGNLIEFGKGDKLILEEGEDDDIFLIVAGSVAIVVKGSGRSGRRGFRRAGCDDCFDRNDTGGERCAGARNT